MNTSIKLIAAALAIYAAVAAAGAHTGTVAKQKITDRQAKIEKILEEAK